MLRKGILPIILCFSTVMANGQSFYFGPKVGASICSQKWTSGSRGPLTSIHADMLIESIDDEGRGSFYGQVGWHTRGSSNRLRFNSPINSTSNLKYKFQNVSLGLGIKKRLSIRTDTRTYYMVGIRGEYTVGTNFNDLGRSTFILPDENFVRRFNYGITVGGGFERVFNEKMQGYLEFAVMPDLSNQYDQQFAITAINPYDGSAYTLQPTKFRNLALEITLGIKFLREVIYLD